MGLTEQELEEIGVTFDVEVICNIADNRTIRILAIAEYNEHYKDGAEIALDKAVDMARQLNELNEKGGITLGKVHQFNFS